MAVEKLKREDLIVLTIAVLVFVILLLALAQKEAWLAGLHECERYADTPAWKLPAKCLDYFEGVE